MEMLTSFVEFTVGFVVEVLAGAFMDAVLGLIGIAG